MKAPCRHTRDTRPRLNRLAAATVFVCMLVAAGGTTRPVFAQGKLAWRELPNAPVASFRAEDIFFANERVGWVTQFPGEVHKTTDGGHSWRKVLDESNVVWRALGFADTLHGWVGAIGKDCFSPPDAKDEILYSTADGGETWQPVTNIPDPKPAGLCGIFVVNRNVMFATGRICGDARMIRTLDGGQTWTSLDLNPWADRLVDLHFVSADSGFVIGGKGTTFQNSNAVLLFTDDGGESWQTKYTTRQPGLWGWKFAFPTSDVGYASLEIERAGLASFLLKTTDGGHIWRQKSLLESYREQGIGFATPALGWVGGSTLSFETTDGGDTWQASNLGANINRIRMISDTVGFAVGQRVYRYGRSIPTSVPGARPRFPERLSLHQNYPNPFNPVTVIRYALPATDHVSLHVYDAGGRTVATLVEEIQKAGEHSVRFESGGLASGVYFYELRIGPERATRKMVLLR